MEHRNPLVGTTPEMEQRVSIFQCLVARPGERFVQGLLQFLLQNDPDFAAAFCRWAGWSGCFLSSHEEEREGIHRHDLVIHLDGNQQKKVELKLWAGLTTSQRKDPGSIDLFIVPARYHTQLPAHKTKTWESFQQEVVSASSLARTLFFEMDDFAWTGGSVPVARLKHEIETWWAGSDTDWRGGWFLKGCNEQAKKLKLGATSANRLYPKRRVGYWGYYLKTKERSKLWLWNGFVFSVGDRGDLKNHVFVLQISESAKRRVAKHETVIPDWYPWSEGKTGILIQPFDGRYAVSDWWDKCEGLLREFGGSA